MHLGPQIPVVTRDTGTLLCQPENAPGDQPVLCIPSFNFPAYLQPKQTSNGRPARVCPLTLSLPSSAPETLHSISNAQTELVPFNANEHLDTSTPSRASPQPPQANGSMSLRPKKNNYLVPVSDRPCEFMCDPHYFMSLEKK